MSDQIEDPQTEKPRCAGYKPIRLELEPGTYSWCACGHSLTQPFCDGSHSCTSFQPIEFTLTEKKTVSLCTCKLSVKKPFCDGTHKGLIPPEPVPAT